MNFFAAVQHPVVAVGHALSGHADDVGTGVRFGQGEGGDGLPPGHGRQVALLLLVSAAEGDGVAAQTLHDEVGVCLRRDPRQLLADDAEVHHLDAKAAVVLRHGVAQQFRLGQYGHQAAMHRPRLVRLLGDGRNAFLSQPPCAVLQSLLFGGECEVHEVLLADIDKLEKCQIS